jgi:methionyl-tRNA formyltransferase
MKPPRIALLLNDRMALPSVMQLLQTGMVVAIGMADKMSEVRMVAERFAQQANVPMCFFHKQKLAAELSEWLYGNRAEVVFVKTFPWLIPAEILMIPALGFINFHYALLPEQRGANPIFWSIRRRVPKGGVSIHKMDATFDTGPVLLREEVPINTEDTYGMFCSRLAYTGASMSLQLLQQLLSGQAIPELLQDHSQAIWYKRPVPADLVIDWKNMDRDEVRALVNACNPWNKGAATSYKGWQFAICDTKMAGHKIAPGTRPGTILAMDEKQGMVLVCKGEKALCIETVFCEEGIMAGYKLGRFGLKAGEELI